MSSSTSERRKRRWLPGVRKWRRLPRFAWGQGDIVLPVLVLLVTVFCLQFGLFLRLFGGQQAARKTVTRAVRFTWHLPSRTGWS